MRTFVLVTAALAACSYKEREREPAAEAPPNMPTIHAELAGSGGALAIAATASTNPASSANGSGSGATDSAPPPSDGIVLTVVRETCAKPNLDDCASATVAHGTSKPMALQGCTFATGLAFVNAHDSMNARCALAVRNHADVSVVDTMIPCDEHVTAKSASCTAGELDVDLELRDATTHTIRIACRAAEHGIACTRAPDLDYGSTALAQAVADLKRTVEAHQWKPMLALCDPDHKKMQLGEMHMSQPQYLAEILGLHSDGNAIRADDAPITFADLARIEKLEIVQLTHAGDTATVLGFATMNGGRRLRITLVFVQNHNRWLLGGAVG